jgi:Beta-lactamase class C and other penicillin binding proteins
MMKFKEGLGWKACYDEERNIYTAQRSWRGFYQLCEIDAGTYDKLGDDENADKLIGNGRVLFESDDDYYTQRYYRIVDENFDKLAPWSSAAWIVGKSNVLDKREQVTGRFPGMAFAYGSAEHNSAQYFGVSDAESGSRVDEETIFPACSVSKFITAICVMEMQELKLLDIDERVNEYLRSWKLLTADGQESDATIRAVLSHTAGIIDGEDSFYGLRIGDPEVSLLDILEGRTKYNNRPVRAEKPQGEAFEYSDAGYCVLQQMVQDVSGKEFAVLFKELVFEELGLKNTFFASPAEREEHKANMAAGYDDAGAPIPGRFPVTPDLAASGLWSTPKDLLTLAAEFFRALNGESTFLQADSAREIIKPAENFTWTGLGVFLDGQDTVVSKGWGENGQCMMKLHLQSGEISVVMTNKNPGVDQAESGVEWLVDSYIWFI